MSSKNGNILLLKYTAVNRHQWNMVVDWRSNCIGREESLLYANWLMFTHASYSKRKVRWPIEVHFERCALTVQGRYSCQSIQDWLLKCVASDCRGSKCWAGHVRSGTSISSKYWAGSMKAESTLKDRNRWWLTGATGSDNGKVEINVESWSKNDWFRYWIDYHVKLLAESK